MKKIKETNKKSPKNLHDLPTMQGRHTPSKRSPDPASGLTYSQTWQFLENISASRSLFICCAVLLPFIALANFPSYMALFNDQDIWFHLAYGREYIQNMTWSIDHTQFSWTPARSEWLYGTWTGSTLLYLIHESSGIHGLFAVHYMVLGTSAGAVLWMAYASGVRAGLWLLTILLAATHIICYAGIYIKPEMFSTLLVTLTAITCFRFRMAPGGWIIAVLPVIFLFWVNMHGLWFFGLAFLGLYVAVSLFEYFFLPHQGLDKKATILLSIAAALTLLALTINPDGVTYPVNVAYRLIFPEESAMFWALMAYDSMWKHLLYQGEMAYTISAWILTGMVFVFTGVWLRAWKRTGRADLPVAAANFAFFLMGMYMARLTLVYAMIWMPSMIFLAWRGGPKPAFSKTGPLVLAAFLLLTGLTAAKLAFIYEDTRWLGFGYRDYIPDKEVAFIMDNNLAGPIFNDYITGGYMMWAMYPEYKVFIDPRQTPYRDQVFPDYLAIGTPKFPMTEQGLKAFTTKYPARIALVQHKHAYVIDWLRNSPDWALAYFDINASVLLHKDVGTQLSPEARAVSLSPERYKDISNPRILGELFAYYYLFGPRLAVPIRNYYKQNVCSLYARKKSTLAEMNSMLAGSGLKEGK